MALKVVGSGLGRTGTKSMQTALAMLGLGPCHHMVEVFAHPETMALWVAASKGETVWDQIFDGYLSAVDYPSAAYWRELADYYPDAKVLHTTRDPDEWFDSTQATIFNPAGGVARAGADEGMMGQFFRSFTGPLAGRMHDRAFMTDYFRAHDAAVRASAPEERLLVYRAGDGWGPLCAFLGVAQPAEPYPSENSRADFQARVAAGVRPVEGAQKPPPASA